MSKLIRLITRLTICNRFGHDDWDSRRHPGKVRCARCFHRRTL